MNVDDEYVPPVANVNHAVNATYVPEAWVACTRKNVYSGKWCAINGHGHACHDLEVRYLTSGNEDLVELKEGIVRTEEFCFHGFIIDMGEHQMSAPGPGCIKTRDLLVFRGLFPKSRP